jgi:hypothetical protein
MRREEREDFFKAFSPKGTCPLRVLLGFAVRIPTEIDLDRDFPNTLKLPAIALDIERVFVLYY